MKFTQSFRLVAASIVFNCLLAAQVPPLVIGNESLPAIEAGVEFHFLLHANGGLPPYNWSVANGELPEGLTLTPDGLLAGRPTKHGAYNFVVKVEDIGHPVHTASKEFQGEVAAPLLLEWLQSPKAHDGRIDGSALVSNSSKDTYDLTVVIVAVAENGRATAIGYQHFDLKAGNTNVQISFGSSVPHGAYTIHADAIAEIPARGRILRQRLQTAQALQVIEGP
jgi:Putative Ig domain